MIDALVWVVTNLANGFVNIYAAVTQPELWLNWSEDKVSLGRFIYYGGSTEFFFAVLDVFLLIFVIGLLWRRFLWGVVIALEAFANSVGRFFAWAGLLMVLQQVMIIFQQRIFRVSELTFSPFGSAFTRDLSWWSEELKLYNAMIVALCTAYTFVQGGHVRVDLFYAGMRHRAKRVVDMLGSLFFIMPAMTLIWLFGWFFLWRHMVTPKISATDGLQLIERKSALLRWNIETIGFSPNGFDAYFLFKILLIGFAGMMFIQGWAFFYRSFLEFVEGPASAEKNIDRDTQGDETPATAH